MKEKKVLEALTDIDDNLIEEAEPQKKDKGRIKYIKWIAAAACIILAIGIGVTINHIDNIYDGGGIGIINEEGEEKTTTEIITTDNNEEIVTEIAIEGVIELIDEDFWKNLKINQRYNNITYNSSVYYTSGTIISHDDVGEKLKKLNAYGTDPFDNKKHTKKATVYRIKNVSDECAVAVKFEEEESYFAYVNRICEFETLGEIMEKLALEENLEITSGFYREDDVSQIKYESIDSAVVLNLLRENRKLKALKEPDEILLSDLLFEIEIPPVASSAGNTISVCRKGYLLVNIFHSQNIFFIGEEKAENFIDYMIKNYKGKKLVSTTEPTVVYNGAKEEIVTEVFSNGYKP